MQLNIMTQNVELLAKQRNVFLIITILLSISSIFLSAKLLTISEKTILVPGLNQEAWIAGKKVSTSYLEENAVMYLPFLLDLDVTSIDWKRDRILSHISTTDPISLKKFQEYFERVKTQYKEFSLSTHFALKKLISNPDNLTVDAYGQLVSRFGTSGFETKPAIYRISFEWIAGRLLIKEFVILTSIKK